LLIYKPDIHRANTQSSSPAKPGIAILCPRFAADRGTSIEQPMRVILPLNREKLVVVQPIESLLPVELIEVRLVKVRARPRCEGFHSRGDVVREVVFSALDR